jgi:hypothetical protein
METTHGKTHSENGEGEYFSKPVEINKYSSKEPVEIKKALSSCGGLTVKYR